MGVVGMRLPKQSWTASVSRSWRDDTETNSAAANYAGCKSCCRIAVVAETQLQGRMSLRAAGLGLATQVTALGCRIQADWRGSSDPDADADSLSLGLLKALPDSSNLACPAGTLRAANTAKQVRWCVSTSTESLIMAGNGSPFLVAL